MMIYYVTETMLKTQWLLLNTFREQEDENRILAAISRNLGKCNILFYKIKET